MGEDYPLSSAGLEALDEMKARVAVTGASGFLGSHMVDFLKKKGHEVEEVDMRVQEAIEADWIMHFQANHGGVGYISRNEYDVAFENADLDLRVIGEAQRTGARLFYPSSSCIYPDNDGKPQGVYGYEKLLMTELSKHAPFDMRVGILGTVFGPRQSEGEKAKFPVDICKKVLAAGTRGHDMFNHVEIWGDGKQVRTFLYVDDFLEMAYELMSADHYDGPTNIASEDQVTIKEITDALCKHAGISPHYIFQHDKPSGAKERREDTSDWKRRYNYRPQVSTLEGFKKLYDYLESKGQDRKPSQ